MQSCHIVVAVRLKTRMTKLRETKEEPRVAELPPPTDQHLTFTTKPDGLSVRYFTIGKTSDACRAAGVFLATSLTFARSGYTLYIMYI
jgi:hypothetical protein